MGVYLISVHLTGVHLTGVHLTGMCLMGVYLMGVHLIGVYLMGVYLTAVQGLSAAVSSKDEGNVERVFDGHRPNLEIDLSESRWR